MLLQVLVFAFFLGRLCVYDRVYLLNQNTTANWEQFPQEPVFSLSSFPHYPQKNGELSSWPNIIRPHWHSRHYNSHTRTYYSSCFTCYDGAAGAVWLKWQPARVSRATGGERENKSGEKYNPIYTTCQSPSPWSGRVRVKPACVYTTVCERFMNTLKSSRLNPTGSVERLTDPQRYQIGTQTGVFFIFSSILF